MLISGILFTLGSIIAVSLVRFVLIPLLKSGSARDFVSDFKAEWAEMDERDRMKRLS